MCCSFRPYLVVMMLIVVGILFVPGCERSYVPDESSAAAMEQETAFWESIRDSTNAEDFQAYKEQFPEGAFGRLADNKIAALSAVAAASSTSRPATADIEVAGKAPPPLTVESLRNAEYPALSWPVPADDPYYADALPPPGAVKLTDGHFKTIVTSSDGTALGPYYIYLVEEPVAFGDLNGDSIDDALVFLRANGHGGNSDSLFLVAVLVNDQGQPRHVASSRNLAAAREGPESLGIEDGYIVVRKRAYGPFDALCCPSRKETVVFKLAGDTLEPAFTDLQEERWR